MALTKQDKMFSYYYELGEKRSLQKVANKFKCSIQLCKQYSVKLNWKEKIKDLDKEFVEKERERLLDLTIKNRLKYLEELFSLTTLTMQYYKKILPLQEKIPAKDIEILIKLIEALSGQKEAEESIVNNININTLTAEDKELIHQHNKDFEDFAKKQAEIFNSQINSQNIEENNE